MNDQNKITWQRILEALTNEDKVLNFPIKYPAIELDRSTKDTLLLTAGILSAGMIIAAILKK